MIKTFITLLCAVLICFLPGCGSVRKSMKHEKSSHDSTAVEIKNNAAVKIVDSVSKKGSNTIIDGNTVIEFDNEDDAVYVPGDELIDADEYKPVTKKNVIKLPGGGEISTNQKIRSINVNGWRVDSSWAVTELHTKDTTGSTEFKSVAVSDKKESTEKIVKRGIAAWQWILFFILLIAAFVSGFWLCWKYKDDIQDQLDSEEN